jgi:hypothetical protein
VREEFALLIKPEIEAKKTKNLASAVARLEGMKSADREKLKAEIDATITQLSGEIAAWATSMGLEVQDFSDAGVVAALKREAEKKAGEVWLKLQQTTQAKLEEHAAALQALDPAAILKYRGSLAKMRKGVSKDFQEFDPNNFDIDFFVQSDKLYLEAVGSGPEAPGEVWGDAHPEVRKLLPAMANAYDTIPGVRKGKFSLKIRSIKNVRELLAKRGTREFAGETHVPIEPPAKS